VEEGRVTRKGPTMTRTMDVDTAATISGGCGGCEERRDEAIAAMAMALAMAMAMAMSTHGEEEQEEQEEMRTRTTKTAAAAAFGTCIVQSTARVLSTALSTQLYYTT
jgi:hypothetical protein